MSATDRSEDIKLKECGGLRVESRVMKMNFSTDKHRYDDIINLPHHVSKTRPQMSMRDRAAQFSPFAALTGYDDAVEETARLTDKQYELSEDARNRLDEQLRLIADRIGEQPEIEVTYFVPDELKEGGAYITAIGCIRRIDEYAKELVFADGTRIGLESVAEIKVNDLSDNSPIK